MKTKIYILLATAVIFGLGYLTGNQNTGNEKALLAAEKTNTESSPGIDHYIRHFDGRNGTPTKKGQQFWYVPKEMSGGMMNLKMSEVKAMDANHGAHQHPEEEIIFLLEGSAEFRLGDEVKQVEANSSLYCPPDVLHGIRNTGNTPIRYFIIKSR